MLSFLLLFYWNFWKFLCKYLIIRQLKFSLNFSKLTRLSKNEKTAKDNMITVLRCYFLPHDFQKILHEFWKILMEYFSKVVEYFPEVGFRGKRDNFMRISKHTHHTHPRNAKRPSTKALRGGCPRKILTKTVTQILTNRVSLKRTPQVLSFRWPSDSVAQVTKLVSIRVSIFWRESHCLSAFQPGWVSMVSGVRNLSF